MIESTERVGQFKADIADMKVKDPATRKDVLLLRLGALLMLAGIVVAVFAYDKSHGTADPLIQSDAQIMGLIGIGVVLIGCALFLRYSIAQFLRFWLARLIYEQRAQTDRLLGGGKPSDGAR